MHHRWLGLVLLAVLCMAGITPSRITAQDTPEYQFLLRPDDEALFRLDCSHHECSTYDIPLPLTDECSAYETMAPTPDGTRILIKQLCPGDEPHPGIFMLDLLGHVLAEYAPDPYGYWMEATHQAWWSPDESFVVLVRPSGPASFAIAFYDPVQGFTEVVGGGGQFIAFSPGGTYMLYYTPYEFPPEANAPYPSFSFAELAISRLEVLTRSHRLYDDMLLTDQQMLSGTFVAHAWLSDHVIWLEDRVAEQHYQFDVDTDTLTPFDPPAIIPSPYQNGLQAERTGNTITIWDTRSGTVWDTMTFTLPDEYAEFDLIDCAPCLLYWLNPPPNDAP